MIDTGRYISPAERREGPPLIRKLRSQLRDLRNSIDNDEEVRVQRNIILLKRKLIRQINKY